MPQNRQEQAKRAPNGTSFKAGQSGNPGGRPKKTDEERDLEALCREKSPEALNTIMELMQGGGEKVRLSAAQYVIDRGWGKPVSRNELTGKGGNAIDMVATLNIGFVGKS